MIQRWCTLEGGYLSYYEGENSATPIGRVDVSEMVSLAISNTETMTGAGYGPSLLCAFPSFPFPLPPFFFYSSPHLFLQLSVSLNQFVVFDPFAWVKNSQTLTYTQGFQLKILKTTSRRMDYPVGSIRLLPLTSDHPLVF